MLEQYTSFWNITHKNADGNVIWNGSSSNARFDQGNELELDVFYRGATPPDNFYIRLFNDLPVKGDLLSSLSNEPAGLGYSAGLIERSIIGFPTLSRNISSEETGTAQAGTASTITLALAASTADDYYNTCTTEIWSGTGAGQIREVTDYDGTTQVATVSKPWTVVPDSTSVYIMRSDYVLSSKTVTFTASGGTWAAVTHAVLTDTASGLVGNAIAFFPLTQSRSLANGDSLEFSGMIKLG